MTEPVDVCEAFRTAGTDKITGHSYCATYASIIESFRDTQLPILELGVCEGYSLNAWRRIFPDAVIMGLDCDPQAGKACKDDPSIRVELLDLKDRAKLHAFAEQYGPFQMIVDDASHMTTEMIACRHILDQFVAPGGVYVIEDVQDEDSMELFRDMPGAIIHDLRAVRNRKDDIMVVFQH